MGWVRAKSMPSLLGGVGTASLMTGSGLLIQGGNDLEGHALGAATSTALAGVMSYRLMLSRKMFPAGIIAVIAAASMAYHGKKVNDWR
ncbi:hypothetical protein CTAYLR_005712 [Chrysophaeum taylorii]|uniref:Transmembrane protein 14C n=1 Tax=Chrysophaeum taylorii TaxID=2483200 RepID=A0AAD7UIQ7_9STRA|nr:hypothetical protein CTAYLR_005712 [Chrysophaeum taylorii]